MTRIAIKAVAALFITAASVRISAAQELIPRKILFRNPAVANVQLSPDGSSIGWLRVTGPPSLWTKKAAGSQSADSIPVKGQLLSWQWSARNTVLTQSKSGGSCIIEEWTPGSQRATTVFSWEGPPMKMFPQSPQHKEELLVAASGPDSAKAGLYAVSLNGGTASRKAGLHGFKNWYVDGDYTLRAGIRDNDSGAHDLFIVDAAGNEKLLRSYPFSATYFVGMPINGVSGISYDGTELFFTDNMATDKTRFYSYRLRDGQIKELAASNDADLLWNSVSMDPKTGRPTSIMSIFGKGIRHVLDQAVAASFTSLEARAMGDPGLIGQSADGNRWLVRFHYGGPASYYLFDRKTGKLERLLDELDSLEHSELVQRHTRVVRTGDGVRLPIQVFLPKGSDRNGDGIPDRPLPTVLYVHGGPWVGFYQNIWHLNRNTQLLANRGYAVINTEFRGSMGYGKKFHELSYRAFGSGMHQDLLDITAEAVRLGIADKQRTGIFGWSYGGYAVSYAMGKSPQVFACGINMFGVNDLERFVDNPIWKDWVGDPGTEAGRATLKSHSPLTYAAQVTRPMLVSQGGKDMVVPQEQSDLYVAELQRLKKPVVYTLYPDEPHDYTKDITSWRSFWAYSEPFLQQYLGGAAEPVGNDLKGAKFEWKAGKGLIRGLP